MLAYRAYHVGMSVISLSKNQKVLSLPERKSYILQRVDLPLERVIR
ncbi:Uncharacterised protein [Chlamydia trachomatis]|nr:Uncharacterised protein [Chlamydia trachomatis]